MKIRTWLVVGISLLITSGPVWAHGGMEHADSTEAVAHVIKNVPLGFEGAKEMLSTHPLVVHFPIALLFMSALFYFIGVFVKKESLIEAGKWTLWSGTLFAIVTVVTGLQAAYTVPHNDESHRIMVVHQNMGYVILGISIVLSVWLLIVKASIPKKGRLVFLVALALLNLILIQQADLGGRMVYLYGTGVGRKSMLQQAPADQAQTHGDHKKMGH